MSEYFISRKSLTQFEVRKFDELNNAVQSVYTLSLEAHGKLKCDCPAGTYRKTGCRHEAMIHSFLADKEPVPFSVEVP